MKILKSLLMLIQDTSSELIMYTKLSIKTTQRYQLANYWLGHQRPSSENKESLYGIFVFFKRLTVLL